MTRGIPGSGKSTLLRAAGLEPYVLSPDVLRLAMSAPTLDEAGKVGISPKNDTRVWELLRDILEERMERGEVVAVDATHTTARYYNEYAQLAYRHRYEMYIIDLSGVSLETAQHQNEAREAYRVVNDDALIEMHKRLASLPFPKGWQVLRTADEIQASLLFPKLDLSGCKRVHHIGDIQGCFAPLAEYFLQFPLRDDEAYIFVGDLLDRGQENDKVLDYVSRQLTGRDNVFFVEGNHDLYIWQWLHGWPVKTREFNGRTRRQLEAADLDKQAVRTLLRAMIPALHYQYGGREVLVTHAGLSTLPEDLGLISAQQCIRGVGSYEQVGEIDDTFAQTTASQVYQVHGHRNSQDYPLQYNERCFNLEGKVEFGGSLRCVQLTDTGFTPFEISTAQSTASAKNSENAQLVRELRANRLISERTLPGNISSFHYRPEVMFQKKWSKQTTTTRGLFVNTLTSEIVIRAYDKFFNLGETRQTEYESLRQNLKFPVKAWVKENGYLGLVGYDGSAGGLVFASKTTTEGDFATWFRELFERTILRTPEKRDYLMEYLEKHNATLVCEVILPRLDPHIIPYQKDKIVLLELIQRQRSYQALSEDEQSRLAQNLGMPMKKKAAMLADWTAFDEWYRSVQGMEYTLDDKPIEGFVLEDAAAWHVKIKLDYYAFWKQMRTSLDNLKKGKTPRVPAHCNYPEEAKKVIAYMQTLPPELLASLQIIDLRQMYIASRQA